MTAPINVDPLDYHDAVAAGFAATFGAAGRVAPTVASRLEELEQQAAAVARHAIDELRTNVPARLRAAATPHAETLRPVVEKLTRLNAARPSIGDEPLDAQGARKLLAMDLSDAERTLRSAVTAAADKVREELATLDGEQAAVMAADSDPPTLDGVQRQALDDLMRFLPHVDPDERLNLIEGHVTRLARSPLTNAGRGLLRYTASLLRSLSKDDAYNRERSATADRGARLHEMLHVVERLGCDPHAAGAERARRYLALALYEVGQLERIVVDAQLPGDQAWVTYALRPESRVFQVLRP